MNKAILTTATAGAVFSIFAAVPVPQVSDVGMRQNSDGLATISYTLSAAPAVVTLDIQTNAVGDVWESIGGKAVSSAHGDVWKSVATGAHTIKWNGATCWANRQIPANGIRAVVTAWALDNTPDYMAVDITAGSARSPQTYYPSADFVPGGVTNELYKKTILLMRKIMAKDVKWTMGSVGESGRQTNEGTHLVTLTNNYYIGVYEVTQTQYYQIMGAYSYKPNNSFSSDRQMRPVENVRYHDIRLLMGGSSLSDDDWPAPPAEASFLGVLRERTGIDLDLPSEAQWEFAARAGCGEGRWGDGSTMQISSDRDSNLDRLARYLNNPSTNSSSSPDLTIAPDVGGTAIVGSYEPNGWGLYDMSGNVQEWCLDHCNRNSPEDISSFNGSVNTNIYERSDRVVRGGAYNSTATKCRSAYRSYSAAGNATATTGFRVVCTAGLK